MLKRNVHYMSRKQLKRKARKCADRECRQRFIPNAANQLYCSKAHQNRDGQRRWRERAQAAIQAQEQANV